MVRREVRGDVEDRAVRGPSGRSDRASGPPTAPDSPFSLDTGMRPASNASSAEPGEVPDNEVNAHLGNPGLTLRRISCATSGEGGSAAG